MKFKVHLLEDIKDNGKDQGFSLGKFFKDLKLKYEIFYWGLHPALAGESIAHVRLSGSDSFSVAPGYDYELDFFDYNYKTKFDIFLGRMKTKLVSAGVGLFALIAFMGASTESASAVQKNSVTPPPPVETMKSQTPVISTAIETIAEEVFRINENKDVPIQLARYHNNTPGYHTNVAHQNTDWANWDNHGNVEWANDLRPHANEWTNTPHSNSPPVEHTNVSSGDIPGDYIY